MESWTISSAFSLSRTAYRDCLYARRSTPFRNSASSFCVARKVSLGENPVGRGRANPNYAENASYRSNWWNLNKSVPLESRSLTFFA